MFCGDCHLFRLSITCYLSAFEMAQNNTECTCTYIDRLISSAVIIIADCLCFGNYFAAEWTWRRSAVESGCSFLLRSFVAFLPESLRPRLVESDEFREAGPFSSTGADATPGTGASIPRFAECADRRIRWTESFHLGRIFPGFAKACDGLEAMFHRGFERCFRGHHAAPRTAVSISRPWQGDRGGRASKT